MINKLSDIINQINSAEGIALVVLLFVLIEELDNSVNYLIIAPLILVGRILKAFPILLTNAILITADNYVEWLLRIQHRSALKP